MIVMIGKYLKTSILFVLFLMVTQVAIGQSFTLQGKVSDKDGNPIELASVMVVSQGKLAMTNLKSVLSPNPRCVTAYEIRLLGSS